MPTDNAGRSSQNVKEERKDYSVTGDDYGTLAFKHAPIFAQKVSSEWAVRKRWVPRPKIVPGCLRLPWMLTGATRISSNIAVRLRLR